MLIGSARHKVVHGWDMRENEFELEWTFHVSSKQNNTIML